MAICNAISDQNYRQLDKLLLESPNLNAPGKRGFTILHWAYIERDLHAFKRLLSAGASPNVSIEQDIYGAHTAFDRDLTLTQTSLRHMCYGLPFFEAALEYVRKPDAKDEKGTWLHKYISHSWFTLAARSDSTLLRIVALGVDLDAQDSDGSTAAHVALGFDLLDICLFLLKAGASPDIPDNQGRTLRDKLQLKLSGKELGVSGTIPVEGLRKIENWLIEHADRP